MKKVSKSQAKNVASYIGGNSIERMAPHLDITEADLPAIKDWSVGKKYKVEATIEMVSQRKGESYDMNPAKMSAGFKVLSIKDGGQ